MKAKELIEILKGHEEAEVYLKGELDEYELEKECIDFYTFTCNSPGYNDVELVIFKCTDEEEDEEDERAKDV